MSRAEICHTDHKVRFAGVGIGFTAFCLVWLVIMGAEMALARASERIVGGPAAATNHDAEPANVCVCRTPALPSIESIDAQTDITVFLQTGVPVQLQQAALRRAWMIDPAIRNFKGLQEIDWDFNDPNGIPGFGELGPETDIEQMVAQILGASANGATIAAMRRPTLLARVFSLFDLKSAASPAR